MNIDVSLPVVGNGIIIYKKLGLVKQKGWGRIVLTHKRLPAILTLPKTKYLSKQK